ncbi:MAG: hypothetical protein ABIY70_08800 [Capsulimonas sp.]|uniref:hypothetical protein n=1 Tax=Capsulimonas sp. TaxID=2494211 RepID=UPI003264BFB0
MRGRRKDIDVMAYGAQNAQAVRDALIAKVDARLLDDPTDAERHREEDVQSDTIADLTARGYTILQTSVRYRLMECPECHEMIRWTGDTGQTPGIPDLLVRNPTWPVGAWLGLEMKGKKTPVSDAQKTLNKASAIVIAKTSGQALAFVLMADTTFGVRSEDAEETR